ncbi:hypothetical protein GCM10012285_22910 [Streptomyces kronopolitis]|uniref:Uncharacterized protein n=1 Tax=Streptomyces kronopolitis TaxID=1612435 RepID=A0ABQ2JB33_9ACTN|nr:hypothetical protein GCM10012285_22910 [Streptomyces kronopolitis]
MGADLSQQVHGAHGAQALSLQADHRAQVPTKSDNMADRTRHSRELEPTPKAPGHSKHGLARVVIFVTGKEIKFPISLRYDDSALVGWIVRSGSK